MKKTNGDSSSWDAVVIGGGFYGCAIAVFLARQRNWRVCLVEQEKALMTRASYNNQARVHNGYHYPRSFITAYRSRINLPRFLQEWPQAIYKEHLKLYAIARRNSKVTARQFIKFCQQIDARINNAPPSLLALFNPKLIENVFLVDEYAFDTTTLAYWAKHALSDAGVTVLYGVRASTVSQDNSGRLSLRVTDQDTVLQNIQTQRILNCTYSGLNQLGGDFPPIQSKLKHEITEMALIQMPSELASLGITVMDGPFFSVMPFPARQLHTLSHVRYTPHLHWQDQRTLDPYQRLRSYDYQSRFDRMIRDVQRYIPAMAKAQYKESLFEVKTVLSRNETDDGRPILFERHHTLPGCWSILGGKVDNIYDVLEKIEDEIR